MNTVRSALGPRTLRPNLSTRYQHLQHTNTAPIFRPVRLPTRHASTSAPSTPITTSTTVPSTKSAKRRRAPLITATFFLCAGLLSGTLVKHIIAPPALPSPGTPEDGILLADLDRLIDAEFITKVLRGKCLGVAKQLKGEEGGWVEIVRQPSQYTSDVTAEEDGERQDGHHLVNAMRGARGLGVQRIFYDRSNRKLVAVIWFGGGLSGWPGVTHGGAIATELAEKVALAASLAESSPGESGVAAAAVPQRMPGTGNHAKMLMPVDTPDEPAQMSFSYVKPTMANRFYVVRVSPALHAVDDGEDGQVLPMEPVSGHEYEATLETLDTRICVRAKAKFAPSGKVQRAEEQVAGAVKAGYTEFKEWLWPSRQQHSQLV